MNNSQVFDEEGFEIATLEYTPDLAIMRARQDIGWNDVVTDDNFPRRSFEQGSGEVQSKLHAPGRQIRLVEVVLELDDMDTSGMTIREGVAWALTHSVDDYPVDVKIQLLGSARQHSDERLDVPFLCRFEGEWYLSCDWFYYYDQWDANTKFLAVRRKFRRRKSLEE